MGIRITPDDLTWSIYSDLIDRIPEGKQSAIPMKSLADSYDMKTSELRAYILGARIKGTLILSGQQGFYLPETVSELKDYVTRRRQVIKTAQIALNPFITELNRIEGGGGG